VIDIMHKKRDKLCRVEEQCGKGSVASYLAKGKGRIYTLPAEREGGGRGVQVLLSDSYHAH
jgi:hypothetical protein